MDPFKKIKKLIENIQVGMFTTQQGDKLYSRPIAVSRVDEDNTLWFFTDISSDKVVEVMNNQHVNFSFSDPGANTYVSVFGKATIVKNQQKIEELWSVFIKAWFPEGKDSDQLTLIKVVPESTQYWDATSSKIVALYNMAKAIVTGESHQRVSDADNKTLIY